MFDKDAKVFIFWIFWFIFSGFLSSSIVFYFFWMINGQPSPAIIDFLFFLFVFLLPLPFFKKYFKSKLQTNKKTPKG